MDATVQRKVGLRAALKKRTLDYYALWILVLLLLGFNIYLVTVLVKAQGTINSIAEKLPAIEKDVTAALNNTSATLEELRTSTFSYAVKIDQEWPVDTSIPMDMTVQVPIKMDLPINTTVNVPIEIPLFGTYSIPIPISTTVPIDMTFEIPIKQDFPVKMTIPVKLDFPIELNIADMLQTEKLDEIQTNLDNLSTNLGDLFDWLSTILGK